MEGKTFWEKLDFFFNKAIPKKFIIIVAATAAMFMNKLDGDLWAYLAMIYMGTNGLQHIGVDVTEMIKARK